MMKTKFNKFEKVAGVFVLMAVLGFFGVMVGVAIKQGWFESKVSYVTTFESADGVHAGTVVQMSGIRVGNVDEVELTHDNKIIVHFSINSKYSEKIRKDSTAQLVRPFVIGERVVDVSVGSVNQPVIEGDLRAIASVEAIDLMSILSGKKLGTYLSSMGQMAESLTSLVKAFSDKSRTETLIQTFDRIDPLVKNLNQMSIEVIKLSKNLNKDERIGVVMGELVTTTKALNEILPVMTKEAPHLAQDMASLVGNLTELTREFKVVIPALTAVAPELPSASKRAVEALNEAVVLLKAMQRSFVLKGSVQDVREEEAKQRAPASK